MTPVLISVWLLRSDVLHDSKPVALHCVRRLCASRLCESGLIVGPCALRLEVCFMSLYVGHIPHKLNGLNGFGCVGVGVGVCESE